MSGDGDELEMMEESADEDEAIADAGVVQMTDTTVDRVDLVIKAARDGESLEEFSDAEIKQAAGKSKFARVSFTVRKQLDAEKAKREGG